MSFKNLIKKVALVAGSVALLATAGGAVSANASSQFGSVNSPTEEQDHQFIKYAHQYGGHDIATHPDPVLAFRAGGHEFTYDGGSEFGVDGLNNANSGKVIAYLNGLNKNNSVAYVKDSEGNEVPVSNNSNSAALDNVPSNGQQSNATQSGNKLVQTGENNSAEYAAAAGAILAVSAVAFAGYDMTKKNA